MLDLDALAALATEAKDARERYPSANGAFLDALHNLMAGKTTVEEYMKAAESLGTIETVISRTDVHALADAVLALVERIQFLSKILKARDAATVDHVAEIERLKQQIREPESERNDWCDTARSEAEALNQVTRQKR